MIPGPQSLALQTTLRDFESRNVTYLADDFPIFWESASGATVTDVDGNAYIDLDGAFGVASVGHSNPRITAAIAAQATRLMHGMGDVHPTHVRARLVERLASILPQGLSKTFLASTGAEAVEAALKTATLATGKYRFAAFKGAYHGLSLGALGVCGVPKFVEPFAATVKSDTVFLDYGASVDALDAHDDLAALIVEPVQARGGIHVPAPSYLASLRAYCDRRNIVLIFDEIYTGFGRTGAWFASQREGVTPDIICIGKAMGSGFPISAAVARAAIMDAWPVSSGEALHTSTFLGNPMGCAAALATIDEIDSHKLVERASTLGAKLGVRLEKLRARKTVLDVRGVGMMWGIQLPDFPAVDRVVKHALRHGVIVLPAGPKGDVLSLTPPLVIEEEQLMAAISVLEEAL
jgi:4-aminobutyrate aminotransferase-like enzyme